MHRICAFSLTAASLLFAVATQAQSFPPAHTVFLLGNTAQTNLPTERLRQLRQTLEQQTGPFTVVHLGDIVGNTGLVANGETALAQAERSRADALIALVKGLPQGKIYFLPGDKDWANSGPDGLKAVRRLEKYIEQQLPDQNAFLPTNGCPGPEVVDVAPLVRLVALNTPWFTHPFDRPEAPDTDCKTLTKEEFREQLQDILDDTKGKNVLLLGHHPVVSNGVYGGHEPLAHHLSPPVFGTIYAAYRQNVGTPRDLANPRYQELRKELLNTLQGNPGVVYAAAHDYSLQLTPVQGNYHLVSGSFAESQHVGAKGSALYSACCKSGWVFELISRQDLATLGPGVRLNDKPILPAIRPASHLPFPSLRPPRLDVSAQISFQPLTASATFGASTNHQRICASSFTSLFSCWRPWVSGLPCRPSPAQPPKPCAAPCSMRPLKRPSLGRQ
ncbi:metallophosphoesterase [Hymenobacter terrenus]|uniref:metallophosphoesterase n=1 Tax=Hymenobacter terrenus TaxID=1629124 RepID=UPI000AD273A4|nr:metallophosphoesterase [Hymenobacter terrenus]